MRSLPAAGFDVTGVDIKASEFTSHVGSIVDREFVNHCMAGIDSVLHTATLHKPHVATHTPQQFIDTNITGTLNLLDAAVAARVKSFVFTSTTSTFGDAMQPQSGAAAVWVNEELVPVPKNIYGVTKTSAEGLCQLFARNHGLPCLVLRTSRFFPEQDDNRDQRDSFDDANLKVNELLFRRADVQDIVDAHQLAIDKAPAIGFQRYIISATPPFSRQDLARLGCDAPSVVAHYFPDYPQVFAERGWRMFPVIGRVYDNALALSQLGWSPVYTFRHALDSLQRGEDFRSPLVTALGIKGYHDKVFADGPYPVDQ